MAAAATAAALENKDCLKCHGDPQAVRTNDAGKTASVFVDEAAFKGAAHGDTACTDCHTGIKELPHPRGLAAVNCAECHDDAVKAYRASAHGAALSTGVTEAASCADCHGPAHNALGASKTNAPTHFSVVAYTCGRCHADAESMEKFNLGREAVVVSYEKSVHGVTPAQSNRHAAACTDCHGAHDIRHASREDSKLYWRNIPATCGKCHEKVQKDYERSVHGAAAQDNQRDAPVCTDCHGEHGIAAVTNAASSVSPAHIVETCGQCHQAERIASRYVPGADVVSSYVQSYHGLASGIGGVSAANCASCHGYHLILPSTDPESSINPTNLPKTCGDCHPGIGTRLASGEIKIHQPAGQGTDRASWVVGLVTRIYIWLILLVVGGMAFYVFVDYQSKVRAHIRDIRDEPGEERLTPIVRAQHAAMLITFVILVYTGFVHSYPDAFFSWPFRAIPDGSHVRGLLHRIAGWAFTGVFVLHLVLLTCTRRGHAYLCHLCPRVHDAQDCWKGFRTSWGGEPPRLPYRRFNFAEKAEYWALIWGSFVMIITGIMLIYSEAVLRYLPKVWLDLAQVIHFYEAVLATLAIIVWHFYWVIFDPAEHPMNPAWLIGHKAPHKPHEGGP